MTLTPVQLSLVHRLRPPAAEAGPGAPPAVLALHGRGSDEGDLLGLAPYLDDRLLWVSARAPLALDGGFEWYRLANVGMPDQATFEAALDTLARFVGEVLAAYPIDARRLFLLGFSQGAMLAYAYVLRHPEQVAGVAAHSGYLPLASIEAAGGLRPEGLRGKPFIILHGTRDNVIPVAWARQARDYVTAAGAAVAYHEYPMAHNVSDLSLAALDDWLRQQLEKDMP